MYKLYTKKNIIKLTVLALLVATAGTLFYFMQKEEEKPLSQEAELKIVQKEKLSQIPKLQALIEKGLANQEASFEAKRIQVALSTIEQELKERPMNSYNNLNNASLINYLIELMSDKTFTLKEMQSWLGFFDKRRTTNPNELLRTLKPS